MTEYIPDLRTVDLIPGLDISHRLSDHPLPGFQDQAGNYVGEGDWVVVGVGGRASYGPRLAQVTRVEAETAYRVIGWEDKPDSQWAEWERKAFERTTHRPQRAVKEAYVRPKVTVAQYPNSYPATKPIQRPLTLGQAFRYDGKVPFNRG